MRRLAMQLLLCHLLAEYFCSQTLLMFQSFHEVEVMEQLQRCQDIQDIYCVCLRVCMCVCYHQQKMRWHLLTKRIRDLSRFVFPIKNRSDEWWSTPSSAGIWLRFESSDPLFLTCQHNLGYWCQKDWADETTHRKPVNS